MTSQRANNQYALPPLQSILDNTLSGFNDCYYEPKTGQWICSAERRAPAPTPTPSPSPMPGPELPRGDGSVLGSILSTVLGAALQFWAQYLANKLAPPKTIVLSNDMLYISPKSLILAVNPPEIPVASPIQPLQAGAMPSEMLNSMVQETLGTVRQLQQKSLEVDQRHQMNQGRSDVARALMEAYGPSQMQTQLTLVQDQTPLMDNGPSSINPAIQESLRNLLAPPAHSVPFISEPAYDYQTSAQKPVSSAEVLRQAQIDAMARQQFEAQQAYYQAQTDLARAQQQALQLQQWATNQSNQSSQQPIKIQTKILLKAEYINRSHGKVDLWQKIQKGQVLSDSEMKQLFHILDLQQSQSQTALEKINATLSRLYAEEQLARNLVDSAQRDTNGNVIFQDTLLRLEDALYFAKQDIQHFQNTDMRLSPHQILATTRFEPGMGNGVNISPIPGKLQFDSNGDPYLQAEKPFTSTQGLAHYQQGKGIPVRIPINWIDTSKLNPLQFPEIQRALLDKTPRKIQIKGANPKQDSTTLDTVGTPMGNILGRVTPKLSGTLSIRTDKTWIFIGVIKIWDDQYNFDAVSGRTPIAEILTRVGMGLKGVPYIIQIRGERSIRTSGKL